MLQTAYPCTSSFPGQAKSPPFAGREGLAPRNHPCQACGQFLDQACWDTADQELQATGILGVQVAKVNTVYLMQYSQVWSWFHLLRLDEHQVIPLHHDASFDIVPETLLAASIFLARVAADHLDYYSSRAKLVRSPQQGKPPTTPPRYSNLTHHGLKHEHCMPTPRPAPKAPPWVPGPSRVPLL